MNENVFKYSLLCILLILWICIITIYFLHFLEEGPTKHKKINAEELKVDDKIQINSSLHVGNVSLDKHDFHTLNSMENGTYENKNVTCLIACSEFKNGKMIWKKNDEIVFIRGKGELTISDTTRVLEFDIDFPSNIMPDEMNSNITGMAQCSYSDTGGYSAIGTVSLNGELKDKMRLRIRLYSTLDVDLETKTVMVEYSCAYNYINFENGKKEVFGIVVNSEVVFENSNIDEHGYFVGISPEKALMNAGLYERFHVASQDQLQYFYEKGMQVCSNGCFESEGKLKAGYPVQNVQPGDCKYDPEKFKPQMVFEHSMSSNYIWHIFVYGKKPTKDEIDADPILKGRQIYPFYLPGSGDTTTKEKWSYFD